jgi:hypothetical protein
LRSWGGPGEGYEWVGREHGIEVDEKGFPENASRNSG